MLTEIFSQNVVNIGIQLKPKESTWGPFGHFQVTCEIAKQLQKLAYRLTFGLRIVTSKYMGF